MGIPFIDQNNSNVDTNESMRKAERQRQIQQGMVVNHLQNLTLTLVDEIHSKVINRGIFDIFIF